MKTRLVTELDINSVKGLVYKKAIESWRKLPPKTRCYIEIDDMYQDGIFCVARYLSQGKFNSKKSKLSTMLWVRLDSFYKRCAEQLNAHKRFDGNVLLIEDLKVAGIDVPSEEEKAEICEHVREVFLQTYREASPGLRESMRRWFLALDQTKIHTHSVRFNKEKVEFRVLATKHKLDVHDCRTLMNCSQIRNDVISRLPEYKYIEV